MEIREGLQCLWRFELKKKKRSFEGGGELEKKKESVFFSDSERN
jgi:hypothetical protein